MASKPAAQASQDLTEDLIQAVVDGNTSKLAALLMSKQGRRAGEALTGTEDALLPMAAGLGHVDMIEHLLGAGFEVDDCTHYGITGLWMAAFYNPPNALACIDLLLSKGANVNATSRERTTPLAMAAMQGHLDIVRRLLAAPGRDVNVRTNLKGSALFLACQRGHPEIVQLLLDAGADVTIVTYEGARVMHGAAMSESVSALLVAGAGDQLEWESSKGLRPLHCAADYVQPATVAQLLGLGAEINARDRQGQTPLGAAVTGVTNRALEVWRNSELSPEEQQRQGAALISDGTALVKLLLEAGSDPNIQWGSERVSALSFAAQGCPFGPYCDILRLLLKHGADLNATDVAGRTAYDLARMGASVNSKQQPGLQVLLEAAFSPAAGSTCTQGAQAASAAHSARPAAAPATPATAPREEGATWTIHCSPAGPISAVAVTSSGATHEMASITFTTVAQHSPAPSARTAGPSPAPSAGPARPSPAPAFGSAQRCALCGKSKRKGGKPLLRCSQCKAAYYCSTTCQASQWEEHKKVCKNSAVGKR